ncbi:TetR/AcrR family transcriptional regulator [Oceanobacillus bengalensis]|uniref:TetR/AcrR family transcriptional regulator n=1 Tax=Oceanobacillus bengalensis TaxID=1435466 RepID=A0A494YZ87_9BACI|nr:TetR/AcrR family transcriptional regulator [Oceanobacillus bengalensis]RKQ15555.1 TetR/AcrR family transcriptional regulator [Oceanobacillus bengalensis]
MSNDRRIYKSKHALKEALILLMEKKNFNKITITDIVTCANLNRGTFYKHYQEKEELLNELIDDVMEDLVHSYREPYVRSNQFNIGELTSSTVKIFNHVYSYSKFYSIIIKSNVLTGYQAKICSVLKQLALYDLDMVKNKNKKIDHNLIASYKAYALFGLIVEWVNSEYKYTPNYMAEQLVEILAYNGFNSVFNVKMNDTINWINE